jgi:ADP-heptose:LPS heptosyltransferase
MTRILVIRTDNIGDLVCTTPLLAALRQARPEAWIGVLASDYTAEVLAGNPHIDALYAYRKAKHRAAGESALAVYWQRLKLIWTLRRLRLDEVLIVASGGTASAERFARWIAPAKVIGPLLPVSGTHEVEKVFSRLAAYGVAGTPPACTVVAEPARVEALRRSLPPAFAGRPLVGLHISARKPSQRWPAERFAELARQLHQRHGAALLLFWAPGAEDDPRHPGDDGKAATIIAACADLPLQALPTSTLPELMAGLSLCERVICADGGAMHVAAGLHKPLVCFFGQSDAARWHPWGVPFELLQKDSREVGDINVDEVLAAYARLPAG